MAIPDPNAYEEEKAESGPVKKDFDCPECSANNPYEDGIREGSEVRCYYCGCEFRAEIRDGKWKFRET
ncbi:MAG TPA: hypothetical protein VGK67_16725 [Myxococcales bacterium]|jgi:transcription elongation factor Elf1